MDELAKFWPYISMLIGAIAAYYGAVNAMSERLARIEEKHQATKEAHAEEIRELKLAHSDLRSRMDRVAERVR